MRTLVIRALANPLSMRRQLCLIDLSQMRRKGVRRVGKFADGTRIYKVDGIFDVDFKNVELLHYDDAIADFKDVFKCKFVNMYRLKDDVVVIEVLNDMAINVGNPPSVEFDWEATLLVTRRGRKYVEDLVRDPLFISLEA